MNEIKRYDYASGMNGFGEFHIWMEQDAEGGYVKFEDHEAEVARLRAEVEKERGYEVAPLEAKLAELRNENEFLRQMIRDANHNQDFDFDAAMGASA